MVSSIVHLFFEQTLGHNPDICLSKAQKLESFFYTPLCSLYLYSMPLTFQIHTIYFSHSKLGAPLPTLTSLTIVSFNYGVNDVSMQL